MTATIDVLHITPHLGGGVGKALSGLVRATTEGNYKQKHIFVCLEKPEKSQFVQHILDAGGLIVVCPNREALQQHIASADIVQLEWWNHPAIFAALCGLPNLTARLLVWCHQSGLINPVIPAGLVDASSQFVLTSSCSLAAPNIQGTQAEKDGRVTIISSGVGCEDLPGPEERPSRPTHRMVAGYLGSLNFSKLHPDYVAWLSSVDDPAFQVKVVGDESNRSVLQQQCMESGRPNLLVFRGYTTDVVAELARIDILIYLLNPSHYGTAENALLEAMAMGVVPIVLNNAAEMAIVHHGVTGMVVSTKQDFMNAVEYLMDNPAKRQAMGKRAAAYVKQRFTRKCLASAFNNVYQHIMLQQRTNVNFINIFGLEPHNWFLSCQAENSIFIMNGILTTHDQKTLPHGIFEKTKGGVFQFQRYFPCDSFLLNWCRALDRINAS